MNFQKYSKKVEAAVITMQHKKTRKQKSLMREKMRDICNTINNK